MVQHRFMQDSEFVGNNTASAEAYATDSVSIDGDEGKWILFSIALLMSWSFLAVALAMGYYSWREDRLLRKYQTEGVVVSGQVPNIVLLREGSREQIATKTKQKAVKTCDETNDADTASLSHSDDNHESIRSDVPYSKSSTYLVAIKYDAELVPGYKTGIIKWIRLQGDVLPRSLFHRKKSSLIGMTVLFNLLQTPTQQDTSTPDVDMSLPLIMLKKFPLSAHPQAAIIKSRSLSSRLVTFSIIAFFAIAGIITHCLAVHIAKSANLEAGLASFHIFSPVALLSLLCVVIIFSLMAVRGLEQPIGVMLEREYTKRGEYAAADSGQTNDFTIDTVEMACRTFSTRSDVFLTGYRGLPKHANNC